MPITLRQLEIFSAVAQHNSISKAAKSLGLSQPAVSKQIQQMERHLGVPVIDIIRQRVHITEMGHRVLGHARRFDEVLNDLNNTVCESDDELTGDLRVGVGSSLGKDIITYYKKFAKKHPKVALRLKVGHREELSDKLLDNQLDLLLSPREYQIDNLEMVPLKFFNFVIVAHKNNPMVGKKGLTYADLARYRFVRYLHDRYESPMLHDLFAKHPEISCMDIDNIEVVRTALNENLGIGLLPDYMLTHKEARNLEVLDVIGMPVASRIYLIHLKNKKLTQSTSEFKNFLIEQYKE